jgi:hypothetical protein
VGNGNGPWSRSGISGTSFELAGAEGPELPDSASGAQS